MVAKTGKLHVANVKDETHQKLKIFAAMVNKEQAVALDYALDIAIENYKNYWSNTILPPLKGGGKYYKIDE